MLEKVVQIYVWIFARIFFANWNRFLFRLSLGGLGILNYQSSKVSGEQAFLKSYLPSQHGVLIDIGANQGNYTKEALTINSNLKGFCFEPHPKTFNRLSENLSHLKNIKTINKGLSNSSGNIALYDYPDRDGSTHASIFKEVITGIHHSKKYVAHHIDVTTLDEFIEKEQIDEISLLKIDTEGNELEILRGGAKALSSGKIKAIHFEFNEMNVISRKYFRDFWEILRGYKIYRLLPNGMLEIKAYNPLYCEIFAYQNIVAIIPPALLKKSTPKGNM